MESQLPRSYGHHYEQHSDVQPAVEDEHHRDKKSMLGKVKDKAKKIKNTLKKHGHGHDHDHDHEHLHDEDDESDQDEEIVQDPEIHGAPIYDSAKVTSIQTPRTAEFDSGLQKGNLEKPSVMKEDRYESMFEKAPERSFAQWEAEDEKVPDLRANAGVPGENLGIHGVTMEEDTNAPGKDKIFGAPTNYETKVDDPTGRGKEAGVTSIMHSLDKMGIYDEHQRKPNLETTQKQGQSSPGMYDELHNILGTKQNLGTSTGSHDQFSPMLQEETRNIQNIGANQNVGKTTGSHDQFLDVTHNRPGNKPNLQTHQNLGSTTGSHDQFSPVIHNRPGNKLDLQTHQNLGTTTGRNYQYPNSSDLGAVHSHDLNSPGIYDEPRTDFHVGAKQSSGETAASHGQFHPEATTTKPTEQSSYTGMISSAASTVADKAISAKDAVTSTLGYGGPVTGTRKDTSDSGQGGGKGLAAKVTETLAPVYEKVAGAGSAVISKVSPSDKTGASSVKEYWIEKLKPGEEDKALSEVISGAISRSPGREEEDTDKRGTREMVSDAGHKRAPDETKTATASVTGRVTESKDLAKQLGLEGNRDVGEGVGVGKGMVDVIRGTVNSWIGNGNRNPQGEEDNRSKTSVKDCQCN